MHFTRIKVHQKVREEHSVLRSTEVESFMEKKESSGIVLPTSREVLERYYIHQILVDTDPKFIKKLPSFQDMKEVVIATSLLCGTERGCQP